MVIVEMVYGQKCVAILNTLWPCFLKVYESESHQGAWSAEKLHRAVINLHKLRR